MEPMDKEMCERDGGTWVEKDGTWMCEPAQPADSSEKSEEVSM